MLWRRWSPWLGAEYRGIVNYYLLAQDIRRLNRLHWVMETSMLKTLAGKHQSTVAKMAHRHKRTIITPDGPRTCFEAATARVADGKPLVARFGGIPEGVLVEVDLQVLARDAAVGAWSGEGRRVSFEGSSSVARLGLDSPTGSERMTDLADGVVYSRSALTYQAGLLEKTGLVTRTPSAQDERSVTVTITDAGRARLAKVLPGHTEVISEQLFQPLSRKDVKVLADLLSPVRDHMRSAPPRSVASRRRR